MLARRLLSQLRVRGGLSPFVVYCQGASALSVAMKALSCWCTLLVGVALSMLHDNEPGQDDVPPILRGDAPPGMFTPRWEELQETYGIDRPRGLTRCVIVIHRMPQDYGISHMPPWDRVVATPDLWPDELIDDITGWFDDLRGRWSEEEWWVRRIHRTASVSRVPILQEVNYVLITRHDFEFYARNPHGLMELGFRDPRSTLRCCLS